MAEDQSPSLTAALSQYLTRAKKSRPREEQQELDRFIEWCGRDRGVDELTPPEVADYAVSAGMWGADSAQKLKPVKSFLSYLKEGGLTTASLAPHLKASRTRKGLHRTYIQSSTEHAELTREGFANLQSRLEMLKEERIKVVADIGRAMADKDFKENAPLDAAKERQGFIESSVRDLEGILANAVVVNTQDDGDNQRVRLGRKVTLRDEASGKKVRYTLVDSREADPNTGKISNVSPVGKALLEKVVGDEVHISVPKGTLHYIIEKIEH